MHFLYIFLRFKMKHCRGHNLYSRTLERFQIKRDSVFQGNSDIMKLTRYIFPWTSLEKCNQDSTSSTEVFVLQKQ